MENSKVKKFQDWFESEPDDPIPKSKLQILRELLFKVDVIFDRINEEAESRKANKYLTISELCEELRISRPTLNRLRKNGLPSTRIGTKILFKSDEVQKFINKPKNLK